MSSRPLLYPYQPHEAQQAQFSGWCSLGHDRIEWMDDIIKHEGRWVHYLCTLTHEIERDESAHPYDHCVGG